MNFEITEHVTRSARPRAIPVVRPRGSATDHFLAWLAGALDKLAAPAALLCLAGIPRSCSRHARLWGSTVHTSKEDYAHEPIVEDMIELLVSLGRDAAFWVGHDWGASIDWALAQHQAARVRAEEVAQAPVWLCSEEASFVTGSAMTVDGGYGTR